MREFDWTIRNIESMTTTTDQSETDKIIASFEKLFKPNPAIKDTEKEMQLKPGHPSIKQNAMPIPCPLESFVGKETNKLHQSGHLEKMQNVEKDCFVFPVVLTVKKDESVKTALDSRKLNNSCIKMRPHIPMMEKFIKSTIDRPNNSKK